MPIIIIIIIIIIIMIKEVKTSVCQNFNVSDSVVF
jgi:hypothetical protein